MQVGKTLCVALAALALGRKWGPVAGAVVGGSAAGDVDTTAGSTAARSSATARHHLQRQGRRDGVRRRIFARRSNGHEVHLERLHRHSEARSTRGARVVMLAQLTEA